MISEQPANQVGQRRAELWRRAALVLAGVQTFAQQRGWGDNNPGELGNDTTKPSKSPVEVK